MTQCSGRMIVAGVLAVAGLVATAQGQADPSEYTPTWTVTTPSADTRMVYVDAQNGSDANNGLSPQTAVRTLRRGYDLLRNHSADWLLLSGIFEGQPIGGEYGGWGKSGRSPTEPIVVKGYGAQRPLIRSGGRVPLMTIQEEGSLRNVVVMGIDFEANTRLTTSPDFNATDPGGPAIRFYNDSANWTFEDCTFNAFTGGFSFESSSGGAEPIRNITLRACKVFDSYGGWLWDAGANRAIIGHSSGMFAQNVDGLVIEHCVFDRNGWNPYLPDRPSTIFNHNIYLHPSCNNVTVRHTLISRAAATGIQLRGRRQDAINCLFVDNPMAAGAGHAQMQWPAQGWTGTMSWNVVLDASDIAGELGARGWGLGAGYSISGSIRHNIIAANQSSRGSGPALQAGTPLQQLSIEHNIVWNWRGLPSADPNRGLAVLMPVNADGVFFFRNVVQQPFGGALMQIEGEASTATLDGNRWFSDSPTSSWFPRFQRPSVDPEDLGGVIVHTDTFAYTEFPDPSRDLARYAAARGIPGGVEGYLARVRTMTRENWDPRLSTPAVNDWVRDGFGMNTTAVLGNRRN